MLGGNTSPDRLLDHLITVPKSAYRDAFRKWIHRLKLCISSHGEFFDGIQYNTIQYNTIIILFHLISYETFTKYFHKHVQHKYKE